MCFEAPVLISLVNLSLAFKRRRFAAEPAPAQGVAS